MRDESTLTLGDFIFSGLEIPAVMPFGGQQRLAIHELVGGARVIDAMGRSDRALTWSGLLYGSGKVMRNGQPVQVMASAVDRARYLDTLRVAGQALALTWGEFSYTVVLRDFSADYRKSFEIPYTLTCEVVADLATAITSPGVTPIDQEMLDDVTAADGYAATVADPQLTTSMNALDAAIAAVSSFANASQSVINTVLQPIVAVQARVGILLTAAANTAQNVTTFGGVLPSTPFSKSAAALTAQAVNAQNTSALLNLRAVTGRMSANLGAINGTQNTVATAGGNLFRIAQQQYGDATAWTALARANGLVDPFIQGTAVLAVPLQPDNSKGVLQA